MMKHSGFLWILQCFAWFFMDSNGLYKVFSCVFDGIPCCFLVFLAVSLAFGRWPIILGNIENLLQSWASGRGDLEVVLAAIVEDFASRLNIDRAPGSYGKPRKIDENQ